MSKLALVISALMIGKIYITMYMTSFFDNDKAECSGFLQHGEIEYHEI